MNQRQPQANRDRSEALRRAASVAPRMIIRNMNVSTTSAVKPAINE